MLGAIVNTYLHSWLYTILETGRRDRDQTLGFRNCGIPLYQLPRSPKISIRRLMRSNPPDQLRSSAFCTPAASPLRIARTMSLCSDTETCSSLMIELAY